VRFLFVQPAGRQPLYVINGFFPSMKVRQIEQAYL
jgi:hypothetical protein